MKYRHYAPAGRLVIVEGEPEEVVAYINAQVLADSRAGERTGILGTKEQFGKYHADVVKCIGSREEEESIARNLGTGHNEQAAESGGAFCSKFTQQGGVS